MKKSKKYASLGLAAALVITSVNVPMNVYAEDDESKEYQKIIDSLDLAEAEEISYDDLVKGNGGIKKEEFGGKKVKKSLFKDEDVVKVIVEVDATSIVDSFVKSSENDFGKYVNSSAATKVQNAVKKTVKNVYSSVKTAVKNDGGSIKKNWDYDTVFTGFSVDVPYGELDTIKATKGVKNAFVSEKYDVPEITIPENEENMVTSREMINSTFINDSGFTGEGMVAAVLDTGVDYNHEAFDSSKLEGIETRETKSSVETSVSELALNASGEVYHTLKVPFGYDYADHDANPIPTHENNHGTHVSGTVVGNSDEVAGVAKDAQLMIFKVFSDEDPGAYDSDILAALEDAVKLNVDTINMSLGSSAGFSTDTDESMNEIYASVGAAGINLDVSAGNSYNSAYANNWGDVSLTTNPDTGIVGSPSTYASSLSVASIENTHLNDARCFKVGDDKIGYEDTGVSENAFTKLSGDYSYVDCGYGKEADFPASVSGKIALISRGEISFVDKINNAADKGAVAAIIYNNTAGSISMSIDGVTIPAVSILKSDGELMKAAISDGVGTMKCDPDLKAQLVNPVAGEMSDFSSWGPTPSLQIKPEITAPGGNIYSAYYVDNGKSVNGNMSGTSMAAPHVTGASTLVREYVKGNLEKFGLDDDDKVGLENMVNSLLMSTAVPVQSDYDEVNDIISYYSTRKQGAGLIDLKACVETPAYLSVKGCDRPKAELGYNEDGVYNFEYTIKNISDSAVSYDLNAAIQVEKSDHLGLTYYVATGEDINIIEDGADVEFKVDGAVVNELTVPAGSSKTVSVKISIDKSSDTYKSLAKYYTNGFFVEGFVFANGKAGVSDLSVPYLAYCGDWAALNMFDETGYSGEYTTFGNGSMVRGGKHSLGHNPYNKDGEYKEDYIAISKNSESDYAKALYAQTYLLRNAKQLDYNFKDSKGNIINEYKYSNVGKSYYYASAGVMLWAEAFMDEEPGVIAADLKDGDYTLDIEATPDVEGADAQTLSYKFMVDSQAPKVTAFTFKYGEDTYLYIGASDNHYLSALFIGEKGIVFDDGTKETPILLKVNKAELKDIESLDLSVYDYANNCTETTIGKAFASFGKVSAKNTSAGKITVQWNKSEETDGYYVYRSTSKSGTYKKIATIKDSNTTSYVDKSGISIGKTYYYKIKSFIKEADINGESASIISDFSKAVSAKSVIPGKVTLSSVKKSSSKSVKLTWKKVTGASGYAIYRSTKKDGTYKKIKTITSGKTLKYTDNLGKKKTAYYKVKAYYKSGSKKYYGSYSSIKKGSTK